MKWCYFVENKDLVKVAQYSQFQRILKSMEDIQDVHFVELENSKYLKPIRMKYTQASRSDMLRLVKYAHYELIYAYFRFDKYTFKSIDYQ